jgi:hypothetical protein
MEVKGMEVYMSCTREAYTNRHCAQQAHEETEKTADALMLETFSICAEDATQNWFRREFFPLGVQHGGKQPSEEEEEVVDDGDGTRNLLRSEDRNLRGGVCNGCITCQSACCYLGYCAGTCGCGCSCDRRRLQGQAAISGGGTHTEFIALMAGAQVKTTMVEDSLSSHCTRAVRALAEKMHAFNNKCMGDTDKIICYATAFT